MNISKGSLLHSTPPLIKMEFRAFEKLNQTSISLVCSCIFQFTQERKEIVEAREC